MSVMSTDDKVTFFAFEEDFVASLRCIPMIVRFKLDLCGVKLSLKAWSRFAYETRAICSYLSVRNAEETNAYRQFICQAIEQVELPLVLLPVDQEPAWRSLDAVPAPVLEKASEHGISTQHLQRWGKLSELQRFALVKLTRKGHENENFLLAVREFGLTGCSGARSTGQSRVD